MNELSKAVAILGRPYSVTRSRLGAITKVYDERYICDLNALKEAFTAIDEKLSQLEAIAPPQFSFLISFSDQTHFDGVTRDIETLSTIPIGKQTQRVVMRWVVQHKLEGENNEISITLRVSNPVNPLVYLQAALSKAPNEIDNMEFEMGATCVTVDGAGQGYADEIFLRVRNWLSARNRLHPYLEVAPFYRKYEWPIDQMSYSVLPLLITTALSYLVVRNFGVENQLRLLPTVLATFFILRSIANKLNTSMAQWAHRSAAMSVFAITNGDNDAITKMAATAKNSVIKLVGAGIMSFALNVAAGVVCWLLVGA